MFYKILLDNYQRSEVNLIILGNTDPIFTLRIGSIELHDGLFILKSEKDLDMIFIKDSDKKYNKLYQWMNPFIRNFKIKELLDDL